MRITHQLAIADVPIHLELSDSSLAQFVLPALGVHTVAASGSAGGLRWVVSDDAGGPHRLWDPDRLRTERLPGGGLRLTQPEPALVELFDPEFGIELWGSRAGLATAENRSHPASASLASALAHHDRHVLHAGAVSCDGLAALLIGPPGAGKSTTAVATALRGAAFIGDDLCAIDGEAGWSNGRPNVHALFASVKVWSDSFDRLGAATWESLGRTDRDKPVVAVADRLLTATKARLVAVIVLRPPEDRVRGPELLSPSAALRGLVSSARGAVVGARELRRWLPLATALSSGVPTFGLAPCWDLDAVASAVQRAIELGAAADHG